MLNQDGSILSVLFELGELVVVSKTSNFNGNAYSPEPVTVEYYWAFRHTDHLYGPFLFISDAVTNYTEMLQIFEEGEAKNNIIRVDFRHSRQRVSGKA